MTSKKLRQQWRQNSSIRELRRPRGIVIFSRMNAWSTRHERAKRKNPTKLYSYIALKWLLSLCRYFESWRNMLSSEEQREKFVIAKNKEKSNSWLKRRKKKEIRDWKEQRKEKFVIEKKNSWKKLSILVQKVTW